MPDTPQHRRLRLTRPLDLRLTLAPTRIGRGDPCTRLRSNQAYRASRTPQGPVTMFLDVVGDELDVHAWGDGAEWAIEQVPVLIGQFDTGYTTGHRLVADLLERMPGLRIGATQRVLEALVPAVCGQKVSAYEAKRSHLQIMHAFGEPAPGPPELGLLVPPHPDRLASVSHQEFHPLGLERRRSDIIRRAAARSSTVESVVDVEPDEAEQRLRAVAGIDLWTSAVVRSAALGDPDAVAVGDHGLKHLVAYVFAGEPRGTDAQMLELLEPFRGQRGRVLRLLKGSGLGPPRPRAMVANGDPDRP